MASQILTPTNMADWLTVLDKIDASITRALDGTAEYEKALTAAPMPTSPVGSEVSSDRFVRGLKLHLDAATRLSEAVEGLLSADEGEARAWAGLANRANARLEGAPVAGIS